MSALDPLFPRRRGGRSPEVDAREDEPGEPERPRDEQPARGGRTDDLAGDRDREESGRDGQYPSSAGLAEPHEKYAASEDRIEQGVHRQGHPQEAPGDRAAFRVCGKVEGDHEGGEGRGSIHQGSGADQAASGVDEIAAEARKSSTNARGERDQEEKSQREADRAGSLRGGSAGDLYLEIDVAAHPEFRRRGERDLEVDVGIGLVDLALGCSMDVPTLRAGKKRIKIKEGTQPGTAIRLKGFGVPASGSRVVGDLYAIVQVSAPEELSAEQKKLFEKLRKSGL